MLNLITCAITFIKPGCSKLFIDNKSAFPEFKVTYKYAVWSSIGPSKIVLLWEHHKETENRKPASSWFVPSIV